MPRPEAHPLPAPRTSALEIAVVALLCAAHALRFGLQLAHEMEFNADLERDFGRTLAWLSGGAWPVEGPAIVPTGFHLGSFYYLILALPLGISANPVAVHVFVVLLATASLALLWRVLRRHARPEVVLLGLTWLAGSAFWRDVIRVPWHSSLLPIFVAGLLLSLDRVIAGRRPGTWLVLGAAIAAAMVQLHATAIAYVLPLGAVALAARRAVPWRTLALSAAVMALVALPLWVGLGVTSTAADAAETPGRLHPMAPDAVAGTLVRATTLAWRPAEPAAWVVPGTKLPLGGCAVLLLAALGGARAIRRGRGLDFPRLLTMIAVVGLAAAVALLLRDDAWRYLHVFVYAVIGLAVLGADGLAGLVRPAVARATAVGATVGLVALGAADRPAFQGPEACFVPRQSALAKEVVEALGVASRDVDRRVHGDVCRSPDSGHRYFYRWREQDPARARDVRRQDVHVHVGDDPSGLGPAAEETLTTHQVGTFAGDVAVLAYRPAIDYRTLVRSTGAGGVERVQLTVSPAARSVHVRFWEPSGPCPVSLEAGGVSVRPLRFELRGGERLWVFPLAPGRQERAAVNVAVGPCAPPELIDLY